MDASDLTRLEEIAAAAEAADGAAPLDEATRLDLRDGSATLPTATDEGFALWRGTELTLVVHPDARGRGVGGRLLDAALAAYDDDSRPADQVTAWSHGNHPAAARLAERLGWRRVRDLWVMRRPGSVPLPGLPTAVEVRGYRDDDRDELLRVNAAAFADHPEQGEMDEADLARRMAEPWWDPAGLLVAPDAEDPQRLAGFHWTKQHSPELGEVYVVGVDPAAQGRGLGRVLTLAGLHHLVGLGLAEVLLYVEADNEPAVRVYSALGFEHAAADTHVMYRRTD